MRVTVAICTWNRAGFLEQTLAEMHKLRIPAGVEWELLVVNNHCTDGTNEVAARHVGKLPLRLLFEARQGLSHARNCALEAAKGELIVWTDDDVLVDPGWLEAYCQAAAQWPQAAFFGGNIQPWFASQPPRWIVDNPKLAPFSERQLGSGVRLMNADEYPFGANMAFRRAALEPLAFDPRFGRVGDDLISGEEIHVIDRLKERGLFGVWVGTARVKHHIPRQRLTRKYVWDFWVGIGRTNARRQGSEEGVYWLGMPRWLIRRHIGHRCRSAWYRASGQSGWAKEFHRAAITWGALIESRRSRRGSSGICGQAHIEHGRATAECELQ
jgi:glycosyltransferase involved in cell wall biosynthesis